MKIEEIAKICHDANKSLCETNGDNSQNVWEEAEEWQRESAIKGVEFAMANPDAPAHAQHDAWRDDKIANGWKYGDVKDADKKDHPCILPFYDLPPYQQAKDFLFKSIVNSLSQFVV